LITRTGPMPPRSIAAIRRQSAVLSQTISCRFVPPFRILPEQHKPASQQNQS
jgi:hypothetical protein